MMTTSLLKRVLKPAAMRVAVAVVLASVGAANAAELASDGEFTRQVAAGGFDELCVQLQTGQTLAYAFDAAADLDFNLHYHRGREVFYPVRQTAVRRADSRFTAAEADAYCLMWENRSAAAVALRGRIARSPGAR